MPSPWGICPRSSRRRAAWAPYRADQTEPTSVDMQTGIWNTPTAVSPPGPTPGKITVVSRDASCLPALSRTLLPRELGLVSSLSNLLFNPLLPGLESPDWRRTVLHVLRDLAGASEAVLYVEPCEFVPVIRVKRSLVKPRRTAAGVTLTPPLLRSLPPAPWTPIMEGAGSMLLLPLTHCQVRIELVHGEWGSEGTQSLATVLRLVGELMEPWARTAHRGERHRGAEEAPRQRAERLPLPALFLMSDPCRTFVNRAAKAFGISASLSESVMVGRLLSTPPWWVQPEPVPGLSEVQNEQGDRFQVFRSPVPGTADTLITLVPLPDDIPSAEVLRRQYGCSTREAQVARLLARGWTTKSIARELEISWHTARGHVERVLRKLGVSSRSQVLLRLKLST